MSDVQTIFPVIQDTDSLLKTVSDPVTEFDDDLVQLVQRLLMTMIAYNGRGISAIQVGTPKRIIIAKADGQVTVMINPVITRTLNRETVEMEGCLSIPKFKWRKVSRPAKCDITWQSMSGTTYHGSFGGESARVLQHEIDHLNGILITDKPFIT